MNPKDFILSMTREDFALFEKRRVEIFLPTKEELETIQKTEYDKKLIVFNDTMDWHDIKINGKEVRQTYWEEKLLQYFNTNRNRFAKWLWNEFCFADLTQVAKSLSQGKTVYNDFIELVYKFDKHDILDLIK